MNDLNRLSILGRVGSDPDVTTLRDGSLRAAFSVATSRLTDGPMARAKIKEEWRGIGCPPSTRLPRSSGTTSRRV